MKTILAITLAACSTPLDAGPVVEHIDAALAERGVGLGPEIRVDVRMGEPPNGWRGSTWCTDTECHVVVLNGHEEPYVVAHELGHAMGLAHVMERWSVMSPWAPPMNAATAAKQLADLCAMRLVPCRRLALVTPAGAERLPHLDE